MPMLLQVAPKDIPEYLKDNGWVEKCPPLPTQYSMFKDVYTTGYWECPYDKSIYYGVYDKCFMMIDPKGSKWGHIQAFNIVKLGDMRLGDWRYTGDKLVSDSGLIHIQLKR